MKITPINELIRQPLKSVLLLPYSVGVKRILSVYSMKTCLFRGCRTASKVPPIIVGVFLWALIAVVAFIMVD
jgi:hypothetical protein